MRPEYRRLSVWCLKCSTLLLNYAKRGTGALIKVQKHRVLGDYTTREGVCPSCETVFGRPFNIRGRPAIKLVTGKIFVNKSGKRP